MRKTSTNPLTTLRNPKWLRGLDSFVDRVLRIYADAQKRTPTSAPKPLAKTA